MPNLRRHSVLFRLKVSVLIGLHFFIRKWKPIGLCSLGILALVLIFLKFDTGQAKELTEGIVGTFQETDLPDQATKLLSQGLVKMNQNGEVVPNLVEGWQVNNNATVFTFTLKKHLYWSDSTKLKSQDISFNIPDVEVSYPDSQTIQFKLKGSFSPFPALLTKPIFKKDTLIGVGPYKLIDVRKSRIFITKLTLTTKDQKLIHTVVIRFYPNEGTAETAFQIGEINALLGLSQPSDLTNNSIVGVEQITNYNQIVTILYNVKDPLLSNRSVRQVLSYSAPGIAGERLAKTSVPPISWAYNDNVNDYLDNPKEAKAALERAKNGTGNDVLSKAIVLTTTPLLEKVGTQVIQSWQNMGLKTSLRIESGIPQNFQALLIAQNIPADPDQYSLWHSTQTKTNLTKYSSARVDKDLEDGRTQIKEADRKLKYLDFQKQLLEDSPATFLYFPRYSVVFYKKYKANLDQTLPLQV